MPAASPRSPGRHRATRARLVRVSHRLATARVIAVSIALSTLAACLLAIPGAMAGASPKQPAHAIGKRHTGTHAVHRILHPTLGFRIFLARRRAHLLAVEVAQHRAAVRARELFVRRILVEASHHRGAPYIYGADGPGAFDCSGFVRYVYGKLGIQLPHSSYAQYDDTAHVPASQAQPGDLLFLDGLGHVAIYAGDGLMWDASHPGGSVELRAPFGPYLVGRIHA